MALKATLKVGGNVYNVRDMEYKLEQSRDKNTGKPDAKTKGGEITFTILANKEDRCYFQKWVSSLSTYGDGYFILPITDGLGHQQFTVEFVQAICTSLQVNYSSYTDKQITMKVTILAHKLIFDAEGKEGSGAVMGTDGKEKQWNPESFEFINTLWTTEEDINKAKADEKEKKKKEDDKVQKIQIV